MVCCLLCSLIENAWSQRGGVDNGSQLHLCRLACSGYDFIRIILGAGTRLPHTPRGLAVSVGCWRLQLGLSGSFHFSWQSMQTEKWTGASRNRFTAGGSNWGYKHAQTHAAVGASLSTTSFINLTTMVYYPSSFGDIIAAVTIAHTIYTALQDSRGSSFEYQCLIDDLRSFETALNTVHDILQKIPIDHSLRDPIIAEAKVCRTLLEGFLGRIQRYEVILSGRCTAIWRKVVWAIFKTKEVESFRLLYYYDRSFM